MHSQDAKSTLQAAQDLVSVISAGYAGISFQITGTWTGTITFEATVDGFTWVAFKVTNATNGASASTATSNGLYSAGCAGFRQARARMSAFTSGIAFVHVKTAGDAAAAAAASGSGGSVTIDDGGDVTQGAIADAGVVGDNPGTVSAKLRGLSTILADVWDAINHRLTVFIDNATIAVTQSGAWVFAPPDETPYTFGGLDDTVQTVKNSAGVLTGYFITNPNAAFVYVQIFDVSGVVTVGTTPPTWSIGIPPESSANLAGLRLAFTNAIKIAATTARDNADPPGIGLDVNFAYD